MLSSLTPCFRASKAWSYSWNWEIYDLKLLANGVCTWGKSIILLVQETTYSLPIVLIPLFEEVSCYLIVLRDDLRIIDQIKSFTVYGR